MLVAIELRCIFKCLLKRREFCNKDLYNKKSIYSTSTRVAQQTFQIHVYIIGQTPHFFQFIFEGNMPLCSQMIDRAAIFRTRSQQRHRAHLENGTLNME